MPDSLLHHGPAAPALAEATARQRLCTAPGELHVSITRDSLKQVAAPATAAVPAETTPAGTDNLEDTAQLPTSTAAAVLTSDGASPPPHPARNETQAAPLILPEQLQALVQGILMSPYQVCV